MSTATPVKADSRQVIDNTFDPFLQDLSLTPDMNKFTFEGDIIISIRPHSSITSLTFNAKDLTFKSYSLTAADGSNIDITNTSYDSKDERITFDLSSGLKQNSVYKLHLTYDGILNDKLKGWQRAKQTGAQGDKKQMATTQMESIQARMAFPCIDEPERKSVFRVRITADRDLMVLGNMPESQTEYLGNNRKTVHFMDTPFMSTQLLAFIVGEYDFVQTNTKRGTLVRTLTPLGQSKNGLFALETAKRTLELYEDWFKINQPLPKMDMIAISEFEAGAMENWGLITQREVDILVGASASIQQRTRVASVVCHEIAHQWFGNLVTMKWWNDLWLNESFATFIETLCVNTLFPEFKHLDSFTSTIASRALNLDSLKSSHPISVPIQRAQEVDEVFDAISQNKGCAVIRMIWEQMGNENFLKGLRNYFIKHKQSNATKHELFKEWDLATGDLISEKLSYWIDQTGFPLVEVNTLTKNSSEVVLNVHQSLQLESGDADDTKRKWFIPLQVLTNTHEHLYELLEPATKIKVPVSGNYFIKLNSRGKSFMRVKQSMDLLDLLLEKTNAHSFSTPDKATLLSDTISLARAGKIDIHYLFKVLNAFRGDSNYEALTTIINTVKNIQKFITSIPETKNESNRQMFSVIKAQWLRLGQETKSTDTFEDVKLRADVIFNYLRVYNELDIKDQDASFISFLNEKQQEILKNPNNNNIDNDLKETVFYNQLKALDNDAKLKEITTLQDNLTENQSKRSILNLIGHVSDSMKPKALEWVLSSVALQDYIWGVSSISNNNDVGQQLCIDSVTQHLETQKTKVGVAKSLLGTVQNQVFKGAQKEEHIKLINSFLDNNNDPSFNMTFKQIRESMENNRRFNKYLNDNGVFKKELWEKNLN